MEMDTVSFLGCKLAEERGLREDVIEDMKIQAVVKAELSIWTDNPIPQNEPPPEGLINSALRA